MAVQDPTVNFSWDLPTNGGDTGAWGNMLRTILGDDSTGVDAVVKAVSVVANAALPKAGGTMTGATVQFRETSTVTALGTISGATTINCALSNVFSGTLSGAITITISNAPSNFGWLILQFTNATASANTITWPAAVKFPSGVTPTLPSSSSKKSTFFLCTLDSGTTWQGALGIADTA